MLEHKRKPLKWTNEKVEQFLTDYYKLGVKKTAEKYGMKYRTAVEMKYKLINGIK